MLLALAKPETSSLRGTNHGQLPLFPDFRKLRQVHKRPSKELGRACNHGRIQADSLTAFKGAGTGRQPQCFVLFLVTYTYSTKGHFKSLQCNKQSAVIMLPWKEEQFAVLERARTKSKGNVLWFGFWFQSLSAN